MKLLLIASLLLVMGCKKNDGCKLKTVTLFYDYANGNDCDYYLVQQQFEDCGCVESTRVKQKYMSNCPHDITFPNTMLTEYEIVTCK